MQTSYGTMKISKGCILYHSSDELFKNKPEKPMLFCTFHPSEWPDKYITRIKLKKTVLLLFMVSKLKDDRVFSSLNKFTNTKLLNLAKMYDSNLQCYVEELKKEHLCGWFTSIQNKGTVEVALINSNNIFEALDTHKTIRNWRNGNCANENNTKIPKKWGIKYPICTINNPVRLNINLRYKKLIKHYKKYEKKSGYPLEYIFQVILENAKIYYHKGELQNIKWKCQ